jgi:hypothetical protein
MGIAAVMLHEAADLAPASPAERLAWRTSGHQIDLGGRQHLDEPVTLVRITQIHVETHAREVRSVRLERALVEVDRGCDRPPGSLQSEAQSTRSREEVDGQTLASTEATEPLAEVLGLATVPVTPEL